MSQIQDPHLEREVVVDDHVRHDDGVPRLARLVALVAGAIVTITGLIALAGIDWDGAEVDSPVTNVGGMPFTPVVAGATAALGLLLLLVASFRDGEGRVVLGAVTACLGGAILLADLRSRWNVEESQGWLLVAVGVVFIVAGMLDRSDSTVSRRERVVDHR